MLVLVTIGVYAKVYQYPFIVHYDDGLHITQNPHVYSGLSVENVIWAFRNMSQTSNWHPFTWLSHMLDVELFGLRAGAHHLVNVALHAMNAALLFLVLRSVTGALWRSAFVAGLFALHPLQVESVAWIAERKNVLSSLFFFSGLCFYVRLQRRPTRAGRWLLLASMMFGLMAKAMLITFPLVLLFLDYWPLDRLRSANRPMFVGLIREKTPLFVLALAFGVLAIVAQAVGGSVAGMKGLPLYLRLSNAVVSCATYLADTFWPTALAVLYPYPDGGLPPWKAILSVVLIAIASILAFQFRRRFPFLLVALLWYLIVLLPVLGILQVGVQARADRYTYLPLIGVFLAVSWGVSLIPVGRRLVVSAAFASLLALTVATSRQLAYWRSSTALFERALDVNPDNSVMHNNLGIELAESGRVWDAVPHYLKAIKLAPNWAPPHINLAADMEDLGRLSVSQKYYRLAVELEPGNSKAREGLRRLNMKLRISGDPPP